MTIQETTTPDLMGQHTITPDVLEERLATFETINGSPATHAAVEYIVASFRANLHGQNEEGIGRLPRNPVGMTIAAAMVYDGLCSEDADPTQTMLYEMLTRNLRVALISPHEASSVGPEFFHDLYGNAVNAAARREGFERTTEDHTSPTVVDWAEEHAYTRIRGIGSLPVRKALDSYGPTPSPAEAVSSSPPM